MAMATDGSIWIAMAGAGLVVGWDAQGTRVGEIAVPHALATSVAFGGPGRDVLYILTGANEDYPNPDGGTVFSTAAPRVGLAAPYARVRTA
jgi:sugar lactone lactonase YvrE